MYIPILFFGLLFGSFINALVWRLARQSELVRSPKPSKTSAKTADKRNGASRADDYSLLKGRSMCPNCGHRLAARDLVPVFSWLSLRGKCRYCRTPISGQYPAVELVTAALFALVYGVSLSVDHPLSFAVFGCIYVVFFVSLAVYDLRWFLLPDKLVIPLTGVAVLQVAIATVQQGSWQVAWQACFGAAVIFSLFWGIYTISHGQWIGGGDVKLAVALGLIAGGPLAALLVVFLASFLGTLASLPLLWRGKRKSLEAHIPFGPYLLAACFIVYLFGDRLSTWYQGVFL